MPQGLKPATIFALIGTTEVVPFQNWTADEVVSHFLEHFPKLCRPDFVGIPPIPLGYAEWMGHSSLR
jgi:hypothetical protein